MIPLNKCTIIGQTLPDHLHQMSHRGYAPSKGNVGQHLSGMSCSKLAEQQVMRIVLCRDLSSLRRVSAGSLRAAASTDESFVLRLT
jgi:hypothetical protein